MRNVKNISSSYFSPVHPRTNSPFKVFPNETRIFKKKKKKKGMIAVLHHFHITITAFAGSGPSNQPPSWPNGLLH